MLEMGKYTWAILAFIPLCYIAIIVLEKVAEWIIQRIVDLFRDKSTDRKNKIIKLAAYIIAIYVVGCGVAFINEVMIAGPQSNVQDEEKITIEYCVRNMNKRDFSYEEINTFSEVELYQLRNAVYAYEGLRFSGELNNFFRTFDWYVPRYESEAEVSQYITAKEWKLIKLIKQIEDERKN